MNKIFMKKIFVLLAVFFLLASCTANNRTTTSFESTPSITSTAVTPSPAPEQSGESAHDIFNEDNHKGKLMIWFFDIYNGDDGTGDSILLKSPDGVSVLIDSGLPETSGSLIDYLEKLNVQKLDYIIATHMHVDHVGGFPEVMRKFPVGKVYMSNYTDYPTSASANFRSILKEQKADVTYVKECDILQFGESISVEVLNPEDSDGLIPEGNTTQYLNDRSVVLLLKYKENTMLFPGDIHRAAEDRILEKYNTRLDVDLVKVPHHGNSTSSGRLFVEQLSPEITVFTNGNMLNDIVIYDRYKKAGSKAYVNALDGNILVTSDGEKLEVYTETERKGNLKP